MQPNSATTSSGIATSMKKSRQTAWTVAQQCSKVLKEDFNAAEVIVFGSLRGDTPWHDDSDLDLAVRGVAAGALWKAQDHLQNMVPDWLNIDLVDLETVDGRVRDRILQTTPIPKNMYLALKLRIEDELFAIEKTIGTLNALLAQADTIPEIAFTPAASAYVEDFYSGCERLAERIAVALDGGLPQGKNWHKQLLQQMVETGRPNRPPLWDRTLLSKLDEYRSFRHRVRHLYNIELDSEKVVKLAEQIPDLFSELKESVEKFNAWLVQKASEKSG